jgi:hypothetical protein
MPKHRTKYRPSETGSIARQRLLDADMNCTELADHLDRVLTRPPLTVDEMTAALGTLFRLTYKLQGSVTLVGEVVGELLASRYNQVFNQMNHIVLVLATVSANDSVRFVLTSGRMLRPTLELCRLIKEMEDIRAESSNMIRA